MLELVSRKVFRGVVAGIRQVVIASQAKKGQELGATQIRLTFDCEGETQTFRVWA
jgi:hypothetical protein